MVITEKKCKTCGEIKQPAEFYKQGGNKNRLVSNCKKCVSVYVKKRYAENPSEKWSIKYPNKYKMWKEKNPEYRKKHYAENREKCKSYVRKWQYKNPEKMSVIRKRMNSTPKGKISRCMRRGIYYSIIKGSKANRHWEDLVGFTAEKLKKHLEKQFKPEMNWKNYGSYWHIDHKIPIAVFNFSNPDDLDFKLCWSLKNLHPLEAKKNISKGSKIDKPFQPSLILRMNGEIKNDK